MIYPQNFEEKLGFHKIRGMVRGSTLCPLGACKVDEMQFLTDRCALQHELSLLDEMKRLIEQASQPLPTDYFFDLTPALKRIRVVGMFLETEELFDLMRSLRTIEALVRYLNPKDGEEIRTADHLHGGVATVCFAEQFPLLHKLAQAVVTFPSIVRKIDQTLTPNGEIRDNASPELAEIRREKQHNLASIGRLLGGILRNAQAEGYVDKDTMPTMRDGRLVIPIPPSSKRKLRGIVHDESATGKTLYVEPAEVVEANNRIRELESEERQEIVRILTSIANLIRPEIDEMLGSYDFLGEVDFLRAKVRFAHEIDGVVPRLSEQNITDWVQARHPLLYLRYKQMDKTVVPLDILLDHKKQRIVLISGPNAGGKSVCLETLGLVQYMLQLGLPVPMKDNSEVAVFDHIFMDIGDEQSIDNDLSTYSSHLQNMKFMLRNAHGYRRAHGQFTGSGGTLVLVDEFGSGTEPQIGGAIAQAILSKLNDLQVNGVITTHFTNLKLFADETPGIVNGAMLYDRGEMRPLFRLEVGRPGSSFALEIAHKIGLPRDVIDNAKEIVGSDYVNMDKYLQDISRDKRYWELKRQKVHQQEKELEQKSQEYDEKSRELKTKRQEVMQQARDEANLLLQQANARIEKTIRDIKEAQAEKEATRRIRKEHESFKEKRLQEPKPKEQHRPTEKGRNNESATSPTQGQDMLVPGDNVRLKGQQTVGEVIAVNGRQVQVAFGMIKSVVDMSRLEKVSRNQLKKEQTYTNGMGALIKDSETPVEVLSSRRSTFKQQLDVRGMRADEALQAVMYYMDDAILLSVSQVRILHGTGTGALRQAIRQYLSTLPGIKDYHDEHVQFGGAGITVVELDS
ncbi:MAG: Smr/MutS family protein [Bacteroidales bacterium]|nr:Smr/MutS family protein [Bacteroidales bacterium]